MSSTLHSGPVAAAIEELYRPAVVCTDPGGTSRDRGRVRHVVRHLHSAHLAAALRDNGIGQVYTAELSDSKIATATATFARAAIADVISVLTGDARTKLAPGALVIADNTESAGTATYLDYVRDAANGYVSLNFPGKHNDTMELSCWTGA